jgi:hypothetical protein
VTKKTTTVAKMTDASTASVRRTGTTGLTYPPAFFCVPPCDRALCG